MGWVHWRKRVSWWGAGGLAAAKEERVWDALRSVQIAHQSLSVCKLGPYPHSLSGRCMGGEAVGGAGGAMLGTMGVMVVATLVPEAVPLFMAAGSAAKTLGLIGQVDRLLTAGNNILSALDNASGSDWDTASDQASQASVGGTEHSGPNASQVPHKLREPSATQVNKRTSMV